jgi:hypothetical protein
MAPHGELPMVKKNGGIGVKPKNVISYQIGVDVLGFPIYMQHKIYKISTDPGSKYHKGISVPIGQVVEQKIIKQH